MAEITVAEAARFTHAALAGCGVGPDDAEIVLDSIIFAHTHGKGTHGLGRLPIYVRKIRENLMTAQTPLTEISTAPAIALLDAAHGFGQVAAIRGMRRAAQMAKNTGIGLVGIRHSNNFGTAAFVANEAVKQNMVGIVFSNAAPAIAPTGGKRPLFGTNPLAFGFPASSDQPPILLDMATSAAARGKIRLAGQNGEKIPFGWALDAAGNPTEDPEAALEGSMVPMAGPKGYGLSLAIDIMAGLLTGSGFAGTAKPLNHPDQHSDCGHLMFAINIAKFMPVDEYQSQISHLIAATKASGDLGAVYLPGERAAGFMHGRSDRIPLSVAIMAKLDALAKNLDIAPVSPCDNSTANSGKMHL